MAMTGQGRAVNLKIVIITLCWPAASVSAAVAADYPGHGFVLVAHVSQTPVGITSHRLKTA